MHYQVNRELLIEQMTTLGLSERQVLARTSMPTVTLRAARIEGYLQGHTSIRQLVELAEVLCVSPADLLASDSDRESEQRRDPDDDTRTLIALLFEARQLVDTGRLARAIGWERSRLLDALDAVPAALEGTGLSLATSGASVAVQAEPRPDTAARQSLARAQASRTGLNLAQAKVLRKILGGDHVGDRNPSNTDKLAMGALKNLGCIESDERGRYRVTDALRMALDLK